jgi:ATP-dependent RNA helicase DDX56/DBP9
LAILNAELLLCKQFNIGNFDYLIAMVESAQVGESANKSNSNDDEPKGKKSHRNDSKYGVSRGLDFWNVSFVVNVDFPTSSWSYTHLVGRTAHGGAKGITLSLVEMDSTKEQGEIYIVQEEQPQIPIASNQHEC